MRIDSATQTGVTVSNLLGRPHCPQCGETLFAATATEFLGRGRLVNTWSCDACDHVFQTMVKVPGPRR
ncbi:MAG: hypothetical protein KJZ73_12965 [Pseudorhodoplanes sp.]|nr:hypothetical protein [Pseudorhodoplanes sp.]MCL4712146.1 hypothetical protein [Pseudorhodoplanes sp.]MCQ3943118.1 hypothetical protein [Alphaproteobacteria bacterium]GIK82376.1 MAG: hypothetical protein BroJett024_34810 [Alphaproteobacteria bacterium]